MCLIVCVYVWIFGLRARVWIMWHTHPVTNTLVAFVLLSILTFSKSRFWSTFSLEVSHWRRRTELVLEPRRGNSARRWWCWEMDSWRGGRGGGHPTPHRMRAGLEWGWHGDNRLYGYRSKYKKINKKQKHIVFAFFLLINLYLQAGQPLFSLYMTQFCWISRTYNTSNIAVEFRLLFRIWHAIFLWCLNYWCQELILEVPRIRDPNKTLYYKLCLFKLIYPKFPCVPKVWWSSRGGWGSCSDLFFFLKLLN